MTCRAAAFFLLAAFAAACTGAAPGFNPVSPAAMLDLGNRGDGPCDVYRGPALLATVPPGTWVTVPNLPGPRITLTARCGGQRFDAVVDLDGDAPRWVVGAAAQPMPMAPARLRLVNRTKLDFDLRGPAGHLGTLLAGASRRLGGLPPGRIRLHLVEREGRGSWELPVDAAGGAWTTVEVDPSRGRLVLRNDSSEPVMVTAGERIKRRLSPGETAAIEGLSPGTWRVKARLLQTRRVVTAATTISAGAETAWTVSRSSAAVVVRNFTDETMDVSIRGKAIGVAEPGGEISVADLTTGVARFTATGRSTGIRLEKDEDLASGATHRWELSKGAGLVTLVNAFAEEVEIYLDGVRSLALGPGLEVTLSLPAGTHQVGWSSPLTDSAGSTTAEISSSLARRITLGPGDARLLVTNRLDGAVVIYLGGRFQERMAPGDRLTLCGLMAGTQLLEAIEEGGFRRIHRRRVDLAPGERGIWEIQPRTFILVLENAAGEDVRALGDLASLVPDLAAGAAARAVVPAGLLKAVFSGKRTGLLYQHDLNGAEGEEHRWTIPRPMGTLVVTNSTALEVTLFEVEQEIATIGPQGRATLDDLAPGAHTIRAQAGAILLGHKDLLVRPGSEFLWDLRPAHGKVRVVNRTVDEVLLFQDGQPTGRLFAGAETTLKDMPLYPVELRAVHPVSGASRAIEITPSTESPPAWFIEPEDGQVEVRGLKGRSGELRLDDGTAVSFDGTRDRVFLSLPPGWHDIRILLPGDNDPDVRRLRVFPGQTTALDLDGTHFALEVDNRLDVPLMVEMDGHVKATIPGRQSERLEGLEPGVRRFRALRKDKDGSGEVWLLREVTFQGGRTYRWTVPLDSDVGPGKAFPQGGHEAVPR